MKWGILGGGLTGLTVSRLMHERGLSSMVIEKNERVGGLCRSLSDSGFTFDTGGSHIIFSKDRETLAWILSVLVDYETNTRNTKIWYKGRYIKYPFENGLNELPKEDLLICLSGYINALLESKEKRAKPKTFLQWIYSTFGVGIGDCYMIPYNSKIWSHPLNKMSSHWVEDRIPMPPVEDIIKASIGIPTEGYTHQIEFYYPSTGGISELIEKISAPFVDSIFTNFNIERISFGDNQWTVTAGNTSLYFDKIVSTIPIQELVMKLDGVPDEIKNAADKLVYCSLITVMIGFKGSAPDYSWVYVPFEDDGPFNRISFPSNYSENVVPSGHSSILAEITCKPSDMYRYDDNEALIQDVIDKLRKMGAVPKDAQIVYSNVHRERYAYVVYDIDYVQNITIIKDYIKERGIFLVGRFSEFEYLNMDGCVKRAMDFVGGIED